ncbi:50S ribosomal protein L6 [Candidatus Woesearchaeota archaeon]|nr:50S ribosomal protein L6 [Candidatus Woesearchaeota archaeon]
MVRELVLPPGVSAKLEGTLLTVKGPKGETKRDFHDPRITMTVSMQGNKMELESRRNTRREKTILHCYRAHILNLIQGVQEPHLYKLKICSGHFPMTVAVAGQELIVKNFLGEHKPRKMALPAGVTVKVDGTEVTVSSPDIEIAGQAAAKIELLCRITNRDIRIFQDGIYITSKSSKAVSA